MTKENTIPKIIENHSLKIIILFQVIISSIIFLVRSIKYEGIMIGNSSYFHAIKAKSFNPLFIYNSSPYQILLSIVDKIFNNLEFTSQILPVILGLITIIIFFKTLDLIKIKRSLNFTTCILVVLSPIYIFISTISNQYILSTLILLLLIYVLIKFNNSFLPLISFIIVPFLGIFETILSMIILLLYFIYYKDDKRTKKIIFICFIMFATLFYFPVKNLDILENKIFILKFIIGFGAELGHSIFILLLFAIGLTFTWKNKKKYLSLYFVIFLLFLSFIYLGQYSNIFLNFILCYFAAIALNELIKYDWNLEIVRDLTLIVLICGLLFTTISYTNRLSQSLPNQEIKSAIFEIEKRTSVDSIILSDVESGLWVQYFAERKTINDLYTLNPDTEILFLSRDFSKVSELLDKNDIDYIYISSRMKQKLWTSDEEGLLFLLPFQGKFKKIYVTNEFGIWQVIQEIEQPEQV